MLLSLNVKNFAIIDNIQVDLENGMTSLTGETGAGKSLIIDAIGLLFGDRSSNELVRFGETKASIEGIFTDYSNEVINILEKLEIDNDDNLIIRREIYNNGKSTAKVNGVNVNLNTLIELSFYLGDIHTQFDTYKLVNPKNYFEFLDDNDSLALLEEYTNSLKEYNKYLKDYNDKVNNQSEMLKKLDYLKFQINELEKAKLSVNEESELQEKYLNLSNHEKIFTHYKDFTDAFDNDNVLDNIYNSINTLKKNIEYNKSLKDKCQTLEESYYNIQDIYDEIKLIIRQDDFDISDLDYINERLGIYSSLKRKYKLTTEELIDYLEKSKKEINELENFDFYIDEIIKQKDLYYNKTVEIGKNIRNIRMNNAIKLKENLKENFVDLELKNVNFEIVFEEKVAFKNNGIDNIDFLISFNAGEPMKPLSKVASGGELSRFMLALKSVTCDKETHKTFIFDEIDTGVSGEIAQKIGEKIKHISINNQVICVTHLPQVAAICDHHLYITKKVLDENRTITNIAILNTEERIQSIALMLSKGKVTDATIALAKELLIK